MKKYIISIFCLLTVYGGLKAQPADVLWSEAGAAYVQARYQDALDTYQSIYDQGLGSADLYYNMGNCCFKLELYAQAVLWFERAKLLDPKNPDILYNLDLVNRFCLDKIESPPEFFLHTWLRGLRDGFSPNQWAWAALLFLAASAVLLLVFFFGRSRAGRRLAFYCSVCVFILCISAFSFGWSQKVQRQQQNYAVVFVPVAYIKSTPDQQGKDLFILHEGTKLRILDQVGGWGRIELVDRRQGWMELKQVERI